MKTGGMRAGETGRQWEVIKYPEQLLLHCLLPLSSLPPFPLFKEPLSYLIYIHDLYFLLYRCITAANPAVNANKHRPSSHRKNTSTILTLPQTILQEEADRKTARIAAVWSN